MAILSDRHVSRVVYGNDGMAHLINSDLTMLFIIISAAKHMRRPLFKGPM
jgi:hypothetical protein